MRIGLLLDDTLDSTDGVQQYVLAIGGWLAAAGHEVHYLVGQTSRTDIPNVHSLSRNVAVQFNGNHLSIPLPASRSKLRRLLKTYNFDILHVQVPYSPFLAGRLMGMVPKHTVVIGTFHILPYSRSVRQANRMLGMVNRRSGRRFNRMIANSPPAAAFAAEMYGYNATIIPNPIAVAQFTPAISPDKTLRIVFLGRLVERKGAQHLLQAISYLHDKQRLPAGSKVDIGGKGPLKSELETYVRSKQLEKTVTFRGFIEESKKANFLAAADIAVFPSTGGESFGISLLEAMAAARGAVIAGDNPGYRSVMNDLETQLCNPADIAAFADTLGYWLEHPAERTAAARQQQNYVKRFDIAVVGKQLLDLYETSLLQSTRAA